MWIDTRQIDVHLIKADVQSVKAEIHRDKGPRRVVLSKKDNSIRELSVGRDVTGIGSVNHAGDGLTRAPQLCELKYDALGGLHRDE